MNILNSYIVLFLLLLTCIPYHSFASDDDQEPISYDAHLLSIEEYCTCLQGAASTEDFYHLYDMEIMCTEILQTLSPKDQQSHVLYSIVDDIDPQSPMLGLTEFDAMRCCNWIETSLPSSDHKLPSTEVGSYLLHQDGSFEVNNTAQLHLMHHNDGTFEIISSVKRAISPLMMFSGEERGDRKERPSSTARDSQLAENDRQRNARDCREESSLTPSEQSPSSQAMNIRVPSLAHILHNDNFDDASLIGHTGDDDCEGNYIAIKDTLWFCPEMVKACFRSHALITQARQQIRTELHTSMRLSQAYKEKAAFGWNRLPFPSGRIDQTKIRKDLAKFDQYFADQNLTRGTLEQFCHDYGIIVPEPRTGRIAKVAQGCGPSRRVDLENLGTQAVQAIQAGTPNFLHLLESGKANHADEVPHERTRLIALSQADRQPSPSEGDVACMTSHLKRKQSMSHRSQYLAGGTNNLSRMATLFANHKSNSSHVPSGKN